MLDDFAEEMALLLMDSESSQITSDLMSLVIEARVLVILFAPRTTQVFQVVGMSFFGPLKRQPRSKLPFEDKKMTAKFILKVYHDFKQIIVESNT
jgi:hypothetical protein